MSNENKNIIKNINKSKKKKNYLVLIIVICIALILGLGIMIYMNLQKKGKINSNNIFNFGQSNTQQIDQTEGEEIAEEELYILNGKKSISEIDNQQKLMMSLNLYLNSEEIMDKLNSGEDTFDIEASKLDEFFEKSSISYMDKLVHEDILLPKLDDGKDPVVEWKYDPDKKKYTCNTDMLQIYSNGFPYVYNVASKTSEFKEENGKYYLSKKYLWCMSGTDSDDCFTVYGSYDNAKEQKDKIATVPEPPVTNENEEDYSEENIYQKYMDENYESIKDKLETYTYVFEKTNDKIKLIDFHVN